MSTATPAIVLGGTGYVAGELLRLIAGHPQLEVAAILSDSQPGAPVAGAFPHLRSAYPELKFSRPRAIEALIRARAASALFSAAPHGVAAAIIDRLLTAAESRRQRACTASISRPIFAIRAPRPTRRCTSMRTAHRRESASSPAPCRSICSVADTPRRASRMLRHRHAARERAAARARAHRHAAVRDRHHRQHGLRAQARRGHASSACGTATCTATAR
jgi:hypothetical protein